MWYHNKQLGGVPMLPQALLYDFCNHKKIYRKIKINNVFYLR